jgi:N-acyl homoserine lactone hydrolase
MPHELRARRLPGWILGGLLTGLGAVGMSATAPAATAQQRAQVGSPRVYIFDAGTLNVPDPKGFGLKREEVSTDNLSVLSFLVVHPKGTLLWDTGIVPDSLIKPSGQQAASSGPQVEKTLKGQLAEIGYTPADITYLALSHLHSDHSANANDYAGSTWLVRKPERDAMFGERPYPIVGANNPAYYSALKNSKTVIIEGDYDVFGDGTVVIKPTPGHTPGHQVLFLKLAKTGPVVLSGDLYHYPEQIKLNRFYANNFDTDGVRVSREALDAFMKKTRAQLWIQHDYVANSRRKKSPAYYE